MTTNDDDQLNPAQRILRQAAALRAHRARPCLVLVDPGIQRCDTLTLRDTLGDARGGALDVLLYSNGGDIDAAYIMARELRKRFEHLAVFVPLMAKSAATLFCLVADELVLGDLGELGPLDAQCDERQQADFPLNTSRLALFKALEQLQAMALDAYEDAVQRVVKGSRMSPFDAGTKAAEVTTSLYGPIYAKIDPIRVAEGARGLEVGSSYALRILARYRSDIPAERHGELVHRLIHAYPSHGFVIDAAELDDLGIPNRAPDATERSILDAIALALALHRDQADVFELVEEQRAAEATTPPQPTIPVARPSDDGDGERPATHSTSSGRARHGSSTERHA